jgi:hypothetical protein
MELAASAAFKVAKRVTACSNNAMRELQSTYAVASRHKLVHRSLIQSIFSRIMLNYESCIFFLHDNQALLQVGDRSLKVNFILEQSDGRLSLIPRTVLCQDRGIIDGCQTAQIIRS